MARRLGPEGRYSDMALPYITPNQLKSMAEKAKSTAGSVPTKTSQLENDSGFVTLTEADSKYAPKGDYATQEQVSEEVSAAKGEIESALEGTLGEYAKESQIPVAGKDYFGLTDISDGEHPDRHSMMMKNDDSVSGYATDGDSYNLAMVSKWDVADFGSRGLPINLNGSKDRPTYNDSDKIALEKDVPLICAIPLRTLQDKVYTEEEIAGWFGLEAMTDVKVQIVRRPVFIKYGITLSGQPMYYFIPCQRAQFEKATELTLQTDGLDTHDDKFKRYTIKMDFSGTVLEGNSNVSLTIEDLYGKVPALPEDASSKTYVLKAVNGKVQWVEG